MKVNIWIVTVALVLIAGLAQAQDAITDEVSKVEGSPLIIEEEKSAPLYIEPKPYDSNDARLVDILFWIGGAAAGTIIVIMLVYKIVRYLKKGKNHSADKAQCPACKRSVDKFDFAPLPRIAVPRRVINIGSAQLILPDIDESQNVEACGACREVGITLARVSRERIYEKRATQRRQELETLVEDQRGMVEQIHKIRFPSNGDES